MSPSASGGLQVNDRMTPEKAMHVYAIRRFLGEFADSKTLVNVPRKAQGSHVGCQALEQTRSGMPLHGGVSDP